MKFLEYTSLQRINDFLNRLKLGECTIKGSLVAYSCKHTNADKKLSQSLEQEEVMGLTTMTSGVELVCVFLWLVVGPVLHYLSTSSEVGSSPPAESFRSRQTALVYLVLALTHTYTDYDFSIVKAHKFFNDVSWDSFQHTFQIYMSEASREWIEENSGSSLLEDLRKALDEVIKLEDCEIYSYNPLSDADPFLDRGALWSFHFLFYNRKMKRVVIVQFCRMSNSNYADDGFLTDEAHELW